MSTNEEREESTKLWLQTGVCKEYDPEEIPRCRDCLQRSQMKTDKEKSSYKITCKFYQFRKLGITNDDSRLFVDGFSDPYIDPTKTDIKLWLPEKFNELKTTSNKSIYNRQKGAMHLDLAYHIISHVGDQFCDIFLEEKNVAFNYIRTAAEDDDDDTTQQPLVWKRKVEGVCETCDICGSTLFNLHWSCSDCGLVVCIDCYEAFPGLDEKTEINNDNNAERDEVPWPLCTDKELHDKDDLMLVQIIPSDCFYKLNDQLHDCRREWAIEEYCFCCTSSNVYHIPKMVNVVRSNLSAVIREISRDDKAEKKIPDLMEDPADAIVESDSDTDPDDYYDKNPGELQEIMLQRHGEVNTPSLIRRIVGDNGHSTHEPKRMRLNNCDDDTLETAMSFVNSFTEEEFDIMLAESDSRDPNQDQEDENSDPEGDYDALARHYMKRRRSRRTPSARIMTITESKGLYPDVPHSWLCEGRLLRLHDCKNPNNYQIFQDQWKRGQPVIVNGVHQYLDQALWHPHTYWEKYKDQKVDLVNCLSNQEMPNQYASQFWDGFLYMRERLKDEYGILMMLKLKDWPKGDFEDILPEQFDDLMKHIPLPEYTRRYGRLNLTSRLPKSVAQPDLGPKMHCAYGSPLYPDKATTNLHFNMADTVNVMVYVGTSKEGGRLENLKKMREEPDDNTKTPKYRQDSIGLPAAIWHIYHAKDANRIRNMLNDIQLRQGLPVKPNYDAIHDQSLYLSRRLRDKLYREYGVKGYTVVQCLGDAVFVPAGAPHQIRNLRNCIKVEVDFVSPERISYCFHLTQEFRALSDNHKRRKDKLQIKNIIYHSVKDSLSAYNYARAKILRRRQ